MANFADDLSNFLKAQSVLAHARVQFALRQGAWLVLAFITATLGLVMLNVTLFLALAPSWGSAWAAFFVAAADLSICLLALWMAASMKHPIDLIAAKAQSQRASFVLRSDIDAIQTNILSARAQILHLKERFWSATRIPFDTKLLAVGFPVVSSVLGILLKLLRRKKGR